MSEAGTGDAGRWLALAATGLVVGLFVAVAITNEVVGHRSLSTGWFGIAFVGVAVGVGFVIARHLPRNPIGWLMLSIPGFVGLFLLGQGISVDTYRHHPLVAVASLVGTQVFYYCFVLSAPLVLLFFPDGGLPSARWRRVLRAYLVLGGGVVLVTVGWGVSIASRGSWHFQSTGNPTSAGPTSAVAVATTVLLAACLVLALSWVFRRIASYRKSTAAVRQQYRWLALGAVCLLVALVVSFFTTGGHSTTATVENLVTDVFALPFPISVGIAILKYRLYDIERVVSRTLSYVLLTGTLAGVYVGIIALATRLLPLSSSVAVAASTLVAVAIFNPLRRRLQHLVDRRFNRARYDAEATVSRFSDRIRAAVDFDVVERDLLAAVSRTLEPVHVALWLRPAAVDEASPAAEG
ncbi:MAG TPA: hypothetical protein VND62_05110 [Acidimicrobiales bacterium]|nr:hypothetical protein [Acidimicrobiales bacterium]